MTSYPPGEPSTPSLVSPCSPVPPASMSASLSRKPRQASRPAAAESSPPTPSRRESALSPTARLRLALATGAAALGLGAALFVVRPPSEPAATAAPSPARPSIAAVDARRETSTHKTAGGYPFRWASDDGEVRTIYFVLWGGSEEADPALLAAMDHGLRVWNDA